MAKLGWERWLSSRMPPPGCKEMNIPRYTWKDNPLNPGGRFNRRYSNLHIPERPDFSPRSPGMGEMKVQGAQVIGDYKLNFKVNQKKWSYEIASYRVQSFGCLLHHFLRTQLCQWGSALFYQYSGIHFTNLRGWQADSTKYSFIG